MKSPPSFAAVRSYLLLLGGLAIIGWEVIIEQGDRPTIIIASLLMMGVSVPLSLDEKANNVLAALKTPTPIPIPTPSPAEEPPSQDPGAGS